jgi:hypothetical protein
LAIAHHFAANLHARSDNGHILWRSYFHQIEAVFGIAGHADRPGAPAGGAFLRAKEWRYLRHNDGREALYRIESDPDELVDVAALHPEVARESRAEIERWLAEVLAPVDAAGANPEPF